MAPASTSSGEPTIAVAGLSTRASGRTSARSSRPAKSAAVSAAVSSASSAGPATRSVPIPDVAIGTYSKIKWEASGGEDVTDGAYRTGQVIVGEVMVMGQTWDWGYTADHTAPVSDTETRPGSTRRSATGPIGRTWGVGWTEGVDSSNANSATTTTIPDFLAYSSGSTSGEATRGDAAGQLKGLLQETRGGEVPVVVLPRIPTSSTIYTDPDLFLYGRIAPELRIENVHGDEGTNTVDRVASVSVREIT